MKRIFLSSIIIILALLDASAAINSQYDFESGVPGFVRVAGNGEVLSSTDKFKDGNSSVRFSWKGQAALAFNNCTDIEASMKVNGAGIMIWI